jgi:hypothetical protein
MATATATAMSKAALVLVHVGDVFPDYIQDCILQIRTFSTIPIHVLFSKKHHERLSAESAAQVECVDLDTIPVTPEHHEFNRRSRLDMTFRGGFWTYTSARFFYLYYYMVARPEIGHVFHMENDTLLYMDILEKLPVFQTRPLWAVFDHANRCIPCFLYIRDAAALALLLPTFIACARSNKNDMQAIAQFRRRCPDTIGALPIVHNYAHELPRMFWEHADAFGTVFDGACVGQYIGGIDPRNKAGDTTGFINETSVIQCDKVVLEWRTTGERARVPYMNGLPLANLHIHSKDLKRWMSRRPSRHDG